MRAGYALAPGDARDVMKPDDPIASPGNAERFYRNVWGYHALNLVVHLLAGLALFGVVRRTLTSPPLRARFGAAATSLAFVVAAIWLVHPLQTESVTYIVQRVESLMGLFYLLTLYCAIRAWDEGPQRGWWARRDLGHRDRRCGHEPAAALGRLQRRALQQDLATCEAGQKIRAMR